MAILTGEGFRMSPRSPFPILFLLFFLFSSLSTADELEVDHHPAKLRLPPGQQVDTSPGAKPGVMMVTNRVYVRGVSRFRNLDKYANSLKVKAGFATDDPNFRNPPFEVCFHRNVSIQLGMCAAGSWEKVSKGHWVRSMSPYDHKILDIRMVQSASSNLFEVSTEEEFLFHRLIFLVSGIILMLLARGLSESVVFYYGSAMAVGVILIVLMILFQGMKLLPTGRKSSLAIFMYSSVVGVATFLLRYLSGVLRSALVDIGITEDMHNPLAIFFIICLVMAGAWLGFWTVRKLVLDEDGSIDTSVAYFVEWTILVFSAALILESSLDTLLAMEALFMGIMFTALSRTNRKMKLLRRLYRRIARCFRRKASQDFSSRDHDTKYQFYDPIVSCKSEEIPINPFTMASCTSYVKGKFSSSVKRTRKNPRMEDTFYSTFHDTPERENFSKEEWRALTKKTTKKALEELISSPDFSRWAVSNADRITVSPLKNE